MPFPSGAFIYGYEMLEVEEKKKKEGEGEKLIAFLFFFFFDYWFLIYASTHIQG